MERKQRALIEQTRGVGTHALDAQELPTAANYYAIELPRCTSSKADVWSGPNAEIAVDLEASFDGGKTWVYGGGCSAFGGIHIRRDGAEATLSRLTVPIPPEMKGVARQVRGTLSVRGQPTKVGLDFVTA